MPFLRGLRAHAGVLLVLGLVEAVAVAGTLLVVAVTDQGVGHAATVSALVVLAGVVLPRPALELARHRRADLVLARLRGVHGWSLFAALGVLPGAATLLGAALGVGAAAAALPLLPDGWDVGTRLGGRPLGWALAVVVGGLVLVWACGWLVARQPLAEQVRGRARDATVPAPATLGGGVALVVAAVAVGYRGLFVDAAPDVVVLVGAGVLGLAVGQVVVWVVRAAAPGAAALVAARSTGVLLGVRRALSPDGAPHLRAVVAAGVVCVAAWSGTTATDHWADRSARLDLGAPVQVDLPDTDALDTLLLTERLDPDGRWLMAGVVADTSTEADQRTAWLDLARYPRVAGAFLHGSPGDVGASLARLRDATPVAVVTGATLSGSARPVDDQDGTGPGATGVDLTLTYLSDAGYNETSRLELPVGGSGRARLAHCTRACVVTRLAVGVTGPRAPSARVVVDRLRVGGTDVLTGWTRPAPGGTGRSTAGTTAGPLTLTDGDELVPVAGAQPAPMLVAGDPDWPDGGPGVTGVGGAVRQVGVVGTPAALPLLGSVGLLGDLPVALAATGGSVPAVRSLVLARGDTPAPVLAALRRAGGQRPRTFVGAPDARLDAATSADSRARIVLGTTAALLAGLALLSGLGGRSRRRARQDADLRLVRVPRGQLRRAGAVEAALLGIVAGAATAAGGWLAVVTVVPAGGLVPTGATLLPLGSALDARVLAGVAVAVGLGTALATLARARGAGVGGAHASGEEAR